MTLKPSRDSDSMFLTKNPKELYALHAFPLRLGSLRVALFLEVRAEAPWEETQGRRGRGGGLVRRQIKVFLLLTRKVLRELSKPNLGLVSGKLWPL